MDTKKILITGSGAAGKTALVHRFLLGAFGAPPAPAIGLKVDKKEVVTDGHRLALILWDLKGELSQEKVPRTYFLGASAVVYVLDLSRSDNRRNQEAGLALIRRLLPGCLVRVVGNKKDLLSGEELQALEKEPRADIYTSARTGENVDALFLGIGQELAGMSN